MRHEDNSLGKQSTRYKEELLYILYTPAEVLGAVLGGAAHTGS